MTPTRIQIELKRSSPPISIEIPQAQGSVMEMARTITNYHVKTSNDPNNRSKVGSDGGIFTPEIVVDPLAYYILAKA